MDLINDTTGERAPGHCIGTDAHGDKLYRVPAGWTPVEPYWLDADGHAHEGARTEGPRTAEESYDCAPAARAAAPPGAIEWATQALIVDFVREARADIERDPPRYHRTSVYLCEFVGKLTARLALADDVSTDLLALLNGEHPTKWREHVNAANERAQVLAATERIAAALGDDE